MIVVCQSGWLSILDDVVADSLLFRVHLYQNNHVPVFTDTIADYVEATFSGYGSSVLLVWGAAFVNGSNQGEIDAATATWIQSSFAVANTIFGIYVTDNAGNLMYAERFPAPVIMGTPGDSISYTARTTLINQ